MLMVGRRHTIAMTTDAWLITAYTVLKLVLRVILVSSLESVSLAWRRIMLRFSVLGLVIRRIM